MPVDQTDMLRRLARLERELLKERVRRIYLRMEDFNLSIPLRTAKDLERLHGILVNGLPFHFATLSEQLDDIEASVSRAQDAKTGVRS